MGSCGSAPADYPPTEQGLVLYMTTAIEKVDTIRNRLHTAKLQIEKDAKLADAVDDVRQVVFLNHKRTLLEIHDHLNKLDELSSKLL